MSSTNAEPGTTTHSTSCPLDCPDSCSLEVEVRDGRVTHLGGDRRNSYTDGFICSKVRRVPRHLYGEDRLLHPLRRTGPKGSAQFERISWDDALDQIVSEIERARADSGAEAILPVSYGGSNGLLSQDTTDARLFHRLSASQLARNVCAAPSTEAATLLYGKMPGIALQDLERAELILVWGCNPSATGIHAVPVLRRAQARGAKLIVVDPVTTPLAKLADVHVAPRPGTDLAIALAFIAEIERRDQLDRTFLEAHTTGSEELLRRARKWTLSRAADESGVPEELLAEVLSLYVAASPAAIRCGWGVERNRNGCSAVAAILALPAVAGKFGIRGGGYTLSNSGFLKARAAAQADAPSTRTVNMNLLGRALLEYTGPPIDLLFVYNCNPLATLPHQTLVQEGLEREDLFTVVFDQVLTDTAKYADIVLPATTFLEHHDLRKSYGVQVVQRVEPVVEPVGEARPNLDVFADLLERLGLAEPGDLVTPREIEAHLLAEEPSVRQQLEDDGVAQVPGPVHFVDSFPGTVDAKVHLCPEAAEGLYEYQDETALGSNGPLALVSPATRATISSTFGQLVAGPAQLLLHPDDAASRNLGTGDRVRVHNAYGEVVCRLRVTRDVRPGVALLPKGLWAKHCENGFTANALAPDTLEPLSGGACFNDARVEVEEAAQ